MSETATAERTQQQAGSGFTAQPGPQGNLTRADQILDAEVEFQPFLAKDTIRLSARLVLKYLCTPTKSGKVCDERQAMRFVMLCKARGLNPWEGDAYIIGYDSNDGPQFSLITAHQAFLKRAETHPEYDGMTSGVIVRQQGEKGPDSIKLLEGDFLDDDQILLGGWATVFFKNRTHHMHRRLKLGVFSTGRSRWQKDPAGMIVKCAEADALRSAFPNALGGMYLEGEFDVVAEQRAPSPLPALPPVGRSNLRQQKPTNGNGTNGHGASPAEAAPQETNPTPATESSNPPSPATSSTAEQPPEEDLAEAGARSDAIAELKQAIDDANTPGALDQAVEAIAKEEDLIGHAMAQELRKVVVDKRQTLLAAAKGSGGRGKRGMF